jgi:two-component system nitrogen regulation response regulator GlnG
MNRSARILIADDDASIRLVLSQALTREGHQPRATSNAATLWRWVKDGEGDLVITDVVMPDENIFEILPRIREARPKLPVIVMSAQSTLLTAVRAAELGAYEYLPKPFDLEDLSALVRRALSPQEPREAQQAARRAVKEEKLPLVGRSAVMQDVYRLIARAMNVDLPVLISGEPGSGKELAARAIHDLGRRKDSPFVNVPLAAATPVEVESILTRDGATDGTLFLDEIGDLPMDGQGRLVRSLQRMGGDNSGPRIVASTTRNLRTLVERDAFREDLFYRLNVIPIRMPSLRERPEDIADLARAFLVRAKREGLPEKMIDSGAVDALKTHAWPGNVRELENLMRRICALYPEDVITARMIERELRAERIETTEGDGASTLEEAARTRLAGMVAEAAERGGGALHEAVLAQVERPLIELCLAATRGNQIKAAELLGVNRNTLRKKIRTLEVRLPKAR